MDLLQVKGIGKKDERGFELQDISFSQKSGQNIAIAGETGSGKTTLLKIIAGLAQPDLGEVRFNGEKVIGPADKLIPGHKGIAYLSQHFELPHFLRVEQVLEYANELSGEKAEKLFELCQITHLFSRRTDQLSGGERQRIAIARLLITAPRLFLLDEPFSNTDLAHKTLLKTIIADISRELNISFMMVSHDPVDTLDWADRILVMRAGQLVEDNTPISIYQRPLSQYTAALLGKYNILPGEIKLIVRPEKCVILVGADLNAGNGEPGDDFQAGASQATKFIELAGVISAQRFYGHYYETDVITWQQATTASAGDLMKQQQTTTANAAENQQTTTANAFDRTTLAQTIITRAPDSVGAVGDKVVVRIKKSDLHRVSGH